MNGVWNAGASIKAIDFAGGTVVHMSSGWSARVLCLILGRRLEHPREAMPPHSMVLCAIGTGMLGLTAFANILQRRAFQCVPMILETPKSEDMHEDVENLRTLRGLIR